MSNDARSPVLHIFVDVIHTFAYLGITGLQDFAIVPNVAVLGAWFTVYLTALHTFGAFMTVVFRVCWQYGLRSAPWCVDSHIGNTRATDSVPPFVSATDTSLDAWALRLGNAWLYRYEEDGLVRHGDRSVIAGANVSGCLE